MDDPGPSSAYYDSFTSTHTGPIRPPSPPRSPLLGPSHSTSSVDELQSNSLYAILNIDRSASVSEIRHRYRTLAATFHPDRQRDAAGKAAAHRQFQEIHRAYEILSDAEKRTIYDMLGEEGLRSQWDVGPRNMTPEEMRGFYQRQAYEHRQMQAERLVKPKGDIGVTIDARAVFVPREAFERPDLIAHDPISRLSRVRMGRVNLAHSFETAVGDKTQVTWKGVAAMNKGRGGANVLGTIRHQVSPRLWMDAEAVLLGPRGVGASMTYTHDENTFVTVRAAQQTLLAPPKLTMTLGRRLYAHSTGFITYKTGYYTLGPWGQAIDPEVALQDSSALSIGITTARNDASGWTVQTRAGLLESMISADWSTRLYGLRLKLGGEIGVYASVSAFVGAEGNITEHVRMGALLQTALQGGVTMRVKFSRLGQSISLPILLSADMNPKVLAGATLIPMASYLAFYHYIVLPRKKRKIVERVQELRKDHAEYISQQKQEAMEALEVLARPTAAKAASEREKNGLVILSAHYGRADAFTDRGMRDHSSSEGEETYIDVTVPIQALVADSKLVVPGGRAKYGLIGFWDPCIGEPKKLRVRYLFRGVEHQVTVDDVASLRAPMKAHVLS